jgi:hypothetical protein
MGDLERREGRVMRRRVDDASRSIVAKLRVTPADSVDVSTDHERNAVTVRV